VAQRPLEREPVFLDGGRRTTQLMRDSLGTHDLMSINDQVDREELERQFRRVGINTDVFAELHRLNNPNAKNPLDGWVGLELDYRATTALLRTLPDGAGEAAFIAAWIQHMEPLRKKAEAAMRAERRKRGLSDSGGPGA
jgi:hypothetical protein